MTYTQDGGVIRPVLSMEHCVACGRCQAVCPHQQRENIGNAPIRGVFAGRFGEVIKKHPCASGGAVTALLCKLLNDNIIDKVIHVRPSQDNHKLYDYCISESKEEICQGSGSAYCPVTLSEVMRHILHDAEARYAVVGVSCFISALARLQKLDWRFQKRVKLKIGLVCGHIPSKLMTSSLVWSNNHSEEDISSVTYHVHSPEKKSWNYGIRIAYKNDHDFISFGDHDFGFLFWRELFSQECCFRCKDSFAEMADVVFMDAWLPSYTELSVGTSIVAFRNEVLLERYGSWLLEHNFCELDPKCLSQAQKKLIDKRMNLTEKDIKGKTKLVRRILAICRKYHGDKEIVEKIRSVEYVERIRHQRKILYYLLRLSQFIKWHI